VFALNFDASLLVTTVRPESQRLYLCGNWSSCGDVHENYCILRCNAVYSGKCSLPSCGTHWFYIKV